MPLLLRPLAFFGLLILAAGRVVGKEEQPPVVISQPNPTYPYEMSRAGVCGKVDIEFIITKTGNVSETRVIRSTRREFEGPAIQAILKWKFKPGTVDGRKVNVRARQFLEFNLDALVPVYPFALLREGTEGSATVEYQVAANGFPVKISVVEATRPEFGESARAMMAESTFSPGFPGDPAVSEVRRQTTVFRVDGKGDAVVSESAQTILKALKNETPIPTLPELDAPPVLKAHQQMRIPASFNEAASALIEVYIDEKGNVQLPQVISTTKEEFAYLVIQAVSDWHYEIPRKNKQPTVVRVRIPLEMKATPAKT